MERNYVSDCIGSGSSGNVRCAALGTPFGPAEDFDRPVPAERPERPVFLALAALGDEIAVHEKLLFELVMRLQPLLAASESSGSTPVPTNHGQSAKGGLPVSLTAEIQEKILQLRSFNKGVAMVLDRLEV